VTAGAPSLHPDPVPAAVHPRQVCTCVATVADRPYTAYTGLRSPEGELTGMLYADIPSRGMWA
jgi:hypothetical protein